MCVGDFHRTIQKSPKKIYSVSITETPYSKIEKLASSLCAYSNALSNVVNTS